MTIHGSLSSVHCSLDLDRYRLIRGLLENNLGEPVEEFLRPYNLQDPSTYVRGLSRPTPTPTPALPRLHLLRPPGSWGPQGLLAFSVTPHLSSTETHHLQHPIKPLAQITWALGSELLVLRRNRTQEIMWLPRTRIDYHCQSINRSITLDVFLFPSVTHPVRRVEFRCRSHAVLLVGNSVNELHFII